MNEVARFSKQRTIGQNCDEIVVFACTKYLPEEKFSKPEHRLVEEDEEFVIVKEQ